MNWQTFIQKNTLKIESVFGKEESSSILKKMAEHITDESYSQIKDIGLTTADEAQADAIILQLLTGRPLQHIIGVSWFYKYPFKVNNTVLIPRPETEELIEWLLRDMKQQEKWHHNNLILEIGTGTGCISISLKKERPGDIITALDVSEDALSIANENAKNLKAEIRFIQQDFIQEKGWDMLEQYDYIISNPPYIPIKDYETLEKNVREFEPHLALFVPNQNPLLFYDKIAAFGRKHLLTGGVIYVEINQQYAGETKVLFEKSGYRNVEVRKDISGNERMLKATL
jgi:release factor glutamine methyltransferase